MTAEYLTVLLALAEFVTADYLILFAQQMIQQSKELSNQDQSEYIYFDDGTKEWTAENN